MIMKQKYQSLMEIILVHLDLLERITFTKVLTYIAVQVKKFSLLKMEKLFLSNGLLEQMLILLLNGGEIQGLFILKENRELLFMERLLKLME
ncbi:hypothetical protein D3C85_1695510 [compost metagenome]